MFSRAASRQTARRFAFARLQSHVRSLSSSSSSTVNIVRRAAATTTVLVSGTLFAVYYFDSRSAIHRYIFTPVLRYALDPETSHKVAVKVLRSGLAPKDMGVDDERLSTELWGEKLSNPIGLAAGFDKNGEAVDGLFDLGFGWVEIGSPGNPTPRVFHLPDDEAIINRYGFPSAGATSVLSRLRARLPALFADSPTPTTHASLRPGALLAINLGKNKTSPPDAIADFLHGVRMFAPYADVLVVNVSSPNTPGLRGLQSRGLLEELLVSITAERDAVPLGSQSLTARRPRVVLKIAPDLSEDELRDIAEAIKARPSVDGVIISNTTIQRPPGLTDPRKVETGGLSGAPLKPLTLRALRTLRAHLPASMPLIGCGGVASGADALEYARAGASAVQLYTAFGYAGVGACRRIKDELAEALASEGTTWNEVVERAVGELSAKAPQPQLTESSALRVLIDEALSIKHQLDLLGTKMGQDIVEEIQPPSALP
ncbi:hypothetical protein EW145_g4512 [Phellinidium pouzarii]|uniref:Dihydroorotate dehydrogenase (quinone), mitochondrial n=1 Tax=Phellinidium pouzarii TaxID=167371 RepID=A0A4S4L4M7_9AGAM|nr:hypothetical protein EW145_g4512 [Phellinidium pouzarii]